MSELGPQHSVRRILLPNGRSIEVVHFADQVHAPAEDPTAQATVGLHICPSCESQLVQPVECDGATDDQWELTLRCPNCHWSARGTYAKEQLAELEDQLEAGVDAIVRDLQRLASANMADEIERFTAALEADLILPEDF